MHTSICILEPPLIHGDNHYLGRITDIMDITAFSIGQIMLMCWRVTGFMPDSITSTSCIATQIRKAWNFILIPCLLIDRSE